MDFRKKCHFYLRFHMNVPYSHYNEIVLSVRAYIFAKYVSNEVKKKILILFAEKQNMWLTNRRIELLTFRFGI